MTTANGQKPKTKRPITIYDCSQDQHAECDYKYLARVWFFRTVAIVVVSGAGYLIYGSWQTATWKTANEYRINDIDNRVKNIEHVIKTDLDSLKSWSRPK